MKLKKRNNLSDLEKELEKLYNQGFEDGKAFQVNALKENRRVQPVDRAIRRIINLLDVK